MDDLGSRDVVGIVYIDLILDDYSALSLPFQSLHRPGGFIVVSCFQRRENYLCA